MLPKEQEGIPCGVQALAVLNCAAEVKYQEHRCRYLLAQLRKCIIENEVSEFSLATGSTSNFTKGFLSASRRFIAML
ncbi:hypothetical protein CYMTET_38701 [Cymbomonas tetramitiformis]|uniref:CHCH domain-containing protein n=1 Tax=Cymbomonas tetramitiformis TaxID=36881 RepID=A0AAE0CBI0_9CHLO|nr:hypothetical protein CYMTET_38701 [Cymbomonas tetramitiformis]